MCQDIGGSDPERMAAPRVEEYIRELFEGSLVKVSYLDYYFVLNILCLMIKYVATSMLKFAFSC